MEEIEVLIPIVMFGGAFLAVILMEKYKRDTNLKMIEHGMNPKQAKEPIKTGSASLKTGGFLIGGGFGLFLARVLEINTNLGSEGGEAIYFGLVSLFAGIGLIIAHQVARKQEREIR